MSGILKLLGRFIYEKRRYLFYSYDPRQGEGREDPQVKVYRAWEEIPVQFRQVAVPSPWMNAMYHRLKRGEATLLCYSEDGQRLGALVWVQAWRPFQRKFGKLANGGTMLGPAWTAPEMRGRGLYGRMLAHSLFVCPKDQPILGYTSPNNPPSRHGIEKAGFRSLGEWELRLYLHWFSNLRQISP